MTILFYLQISNICKRPVECVCVRWCGVGRYVGDVGGLCVLGRCTVTTLGCFAKVVLNVSLN